MAEIENLRIGNGTIHIVGNQDIVADSWEEGKTYVAGRSYVILDHILYVCNTTHTSVSPFDPNLWTETTIGEALGMAGSANVIECTQSEYNTWKAGGLLINETTYVITDAPNLNATAQNLSYDGGVTSTWDKVEANATAISGILSNISALSNLSTKVYVAGNTSKTITVTPDGSSRVGYVVFGQAAQGNLSPIFYLIGGYVTASRCSVTNISGKTGVTVDSSSTTDLKFVFANTTSVAVDLFFYPLFENTFTAS
jgi:hypothetical protein